MFFVCKGSNSMKDILVKTIVVKFRAEGKNTFCLVYAPAVEVPPAFHQ